ncbi:ATP-dependent RNA helicase [Rhizobium rhizosphaerae]|uniref:ATP-dependent RNA helicase n=1 Tax=Xaviernesmea rhizosphaerae TaxID=1672749 RepID=A0ABX3PHC0_9HYPH|nr:DEAD/DEAH box helicase [Xaviernesmea rhizosphaerae]OQP87905.1 ATP-dependent RNA helicase [Xaviernesmea rhizosphaerae]
MSEFEGVVPAIADALAKRGYSTLTPVQKAVLSPEMDGRDALVSAQTGSGKTVAFGLAVAPTLLKGEGRFGRAGAPLCVVVAPTRELAMQVKREFEWLYELTGAEIASCVGGMDVRTERRALERGAHIVVGTPGRLCDHVRRGALDLSKTRAVVLDEADEMLDLGFREDLEFLLDSAPADRRTLMFSATVPKAIANLAASYQRDALRLATQAEQKQHVDIDYQALVVIPADRENAIINLLRYHDAQNAIVFCSTRAAVNHLTARLHNRGFAVVALSGELSQSERTHALQAMRDGRARVCIATDVAARGIDLPGLELVIHADLPTNPETLLHRSGRTGRAGSKGISALVVPTSARRKAERILREARIEANWTRPPSADEVLKRDDERVLADPSLLEPIGEEEASLAADIVARFTPEAIAAAFVRRLRAGRSAPEDLVEVSAAAAPRERGTRDRAEGGFEPSPRAPRENFGEAVWFELSAGRRDKVEPRWLIPVMCRIGKITKQEIGAIKMQQDVTYVEIARDWAERFSSALGPKGQLERGITVKELSGAPDLSDSRRPAAKKPFQRDGASDFRESPKGGKPAWKSDRREGEGAKPWSPKGPRAEEGGRFERKAGEGRSFEKKGYEPRGEKKAGGKPFKKGPKA